MDMNHESLISFITISQNRNVKTAYDLPTVELCTEQINQTEQNLDPLEELANEKLAVDATALFKLVTQ